MKKCSYCDLNSHVRSEYDYEEFLKLIIREIEWWNRKKPNLSVKTIFFGGGTPSLMKAEWIKSIIDKIKLIWDCTQLTEVTIEANPAITECTDLAALKWAGINRISFGVQSFSNNILKVLGRTHDAEQALGLIEAAQNIFDEVSIDLMYAIPGQTLDDIQLALDHIINKKLTHVSWYALTIHENTEFGNLYKMGKLKLPEDDIFCDTYWLIHNALTKVGMIHYEISNFSYPQYMSKHNMIYWDYQNFLGIGPGAHSRIHLDSATWQVANYKLPEKWGNSVIDKGNGIEVFEPINPETMQEEEFIMKMRTYKGLNADEVHRLIQDKKKIDSMLSINCINRNDSGGISLTAEGFLKYNSVIRYLYL